MHQLPQSVTWLRSGYAGMKPGKVELREFEYIRHGTQCLIVNFEVATGQIIAPTIGPTRTEADFVSHIEQTIATKPEAE